MEERGPRRLQHPVSGAALTKGRTTMCLQPADLNWSHEEHNETFLFVRRAVKLYLCGKGRQAVAVFMALTFVRLHCFVGITAAGWLLIDWIRGAAVKLATLVGCRYIAFRPSGP